MRWLLLVCWWCFSLAATDVVVQHDYLEFRSGPGRGYPVVQVATYGESLQLVKRRTDWVQVYYRRQVLWLAAEDLSAVGLKLQGQSMEALWQPAAMSNRWQAGLQLGDLTGASYYEVLGRYKPGDFLYAQLSGGQASGQLASSQLFLIMLGMQPFPEWRLSPGMALGAGALLTKPKTVLVQTSHTSNPVAMLELAADYRWQQRTTLRISYRRAVITTARDENKEINLWLIGVQFAF